jgi:hypothetical protein
LTVPPATRSSASSARPVRRPMSSSHRTGVLTRGRRDPLLQVFTSRRGRHLRRARPQADGDLYRRRTEARLRSLPVRRYFRSRWNRSRTDRGRGPDASLSTASVCSVTRTYQTRRSLRAPQGRTTPTTSMSRTRSSSTRSQHIFRIWECRAQRLLRRAAERLRSTQVME